MIKRYTDEDIRSLAIPAGLVCQWVREAFLAKSDCQLPHKVSLTFDGGRKFFNTMPTIMPMDGCFGVKIVSRYPGRAPSIQADLLLYDLNDGTLLAMMDATWITAKRTGAVAALTVETLAISGAQVISVMGLGATGLAFLEMLLANPDRKRMQFRLLRYKDHAEKARHWLLSEGVGHVEICGSHEALIRGADVVVSAVTVAETLVAQLDWFKSGVLLVPIHTRGFQNCDAAFDRVIVDDRSHVEGFGNFRLFRGFAELDAVLRGEDPGRQDLGQRILAYNIGIALHDIHIGRRLLDLLT